MKIFNFLIAVMGFSTLGATAMASEHVDIMCLSASGGVSIRLQSDFSGVYKITKTLNDDPFHTQMDHLVVSSGDQLFKNDADGLSFHYKTADGGTFIQSIDISGPTADQPGVLYKSKISIQIGNFGQGVSTADLFKQSSDENFGCWKKQ